VEDDPKSIEKRGASPSTRALISQAVKRLWADPETRRKRLDAIARGHANPKVRKRMRQVTKRNWKDPKIRKARTEGTRRALADPSVRGRMGAASKSSWADPKVRKARTEGIQKALANPSVRNRISEANKRSWASNTAGRQRQSEHSKRVWAERLSRLASALPPDWQDKSPLWQIIGMELLSRDHMTNYELARRLDRSGILKCPYGPHGSTWESSRNTRGCLEFIRKVRNWVGRPGRSSQPSQ